MRDNHLPISVFRMLSDNNKVFDTRFIAEVLMQDASTIREVIENRMGCFIDKDDKVYLMS